jgi:hypothetical protein
MNNLKLLETFNFSKKLRLGAKYDGGYVIADLDNYDCYISAGIGYEESFSRDFLNKYDIDKNNSYAFDGTINDYPHTFVSADKITFLKKNIGPVNSDKSTNLMDLIKKYNNIFLKIDVEGGEYPWLYCLDENDLVNFKQIVIEFHGITGNTWDCYYEDKIKCLEKLAKTHYIVHAHGNNYSPTCNKIPDVIELTYVNKKYFNGIAPELNEIKFPVANLDFPNNPNLADCDLNFYPFVKIPDVVNE